tara:strand:+ start:1365 stop:2228 length:864 start_codon:yes stop_codon:yes gene_type:complete
MAETLTVNDTPQQEGLTAEEQDSLQVGEQMAEQQGELLAGKYKNAEELEQAYVELQKKLGEKDGVSQEGREETQEVEAKEETETEQQLYKEDGSVNYESVVENYGETLGNLFKEKNVDPYSIAKHFYENNGQITQEMHDQLTGAGIAKEAVDAYLSGRAKDMGMNSDLSQADIDSIKTSVGGEKAYDNLMNWAGQTLSQDAINSFENLINIGDKNSIQLAVNGLVAQYQNDNGYEGRMLTGKAAKTNTDIFQSQAQLVEAMADPRYDRDPAYREAVREKLDRSDLKF